MTNENKKTVETVKTIEKGKQPDPQLPELEDLSEHDLEEVAGASCGWTKVQPTQAC